MYPGAQAPNSYMLQRARMLRTGAPRGDVPLRSGIANDTKVQQGGFTYVLSFPSDLRSIQHVKDGNDPATGSGRNAGVYLNNRADAEGKARALTPLLVSVPFPEAGREPQARYVRLPIVFLTSWCWALMAS